MAPRSCVMQAVAKNPTTGWFLVTFLGWRKRDPKSEVAGDLQRSGIKRAHLESPGIWFSRTMMINLLNSTFYCRFQQVQKIQLITSFFKVTFWFPKSRSLNPYKGHLWVQTRSLWRTWYASFSIGKNRRKIPNNFQGFSVSPLVPCFPEAWHSWRSQRHRLCLWVARVTTTRRQGKREGELGHLGALELCIWGFGGRFGFEDDMDGWEIWRWHGWVCLGIVLWGGPLVGRVRIWVRWHGWMGEVHWWWIWLGWVGWVWLVDSSSIGSGWKVVIFLGSTVGVFFFSGGNWPSFSGRKAGKTWFIYRYTPLEKNHILLYKLHRLTLTCVLFFYG